jgi:hypothetical protein
LLVLPVVLTGCFRIFRGLTDAPAPDASLDVRDTGAIVQHHDTGELAPPGLIHRYTFAGNGTQVLDTIGTAHGEVVNTTLDGDGNLTLAGGVSDQYVNLPNGLLSSLTNVPLESWVTWNGGNGFQRLFDFGNSTDGEDGQGRGLTQLSLAFYGNSELIRLLFDQDPGSGSEGWYQVVVAFVPGGRRHVVTVFDAGGALPRLLLYIDGDYASGRSLGATEALANIVDNNNWLGRAQWTGDPELNGVLHEFRIYDRALTASEIRDSFALGPDRLLP